MENLSAGVSCGVLSAVAHPTLPLLRGLPARLTDAIGLLIRPPAEPIEKVTGVVIVEDALEDVVVTLTCSPPPFYLPFYPSADPDLFVGRHTTLTLLLTLLWLLVRRSRLA